MEGRPTEIYSLLVPLTEGRLVIPRACVAEVIAYQAPSELPGVSPWYLGLVPWNGKAVSVVSFEGACGHAMPAATARTRTVVLHCSGRNVPGGHFALIAQGFPQLVRVSAEGVRPDNSRVFPDRSPILCQVRLLNETPLVPDLERLEEMLAQDIRSARRA
jgi:chemosensory pili system protein ChpC